MEIERNGESVTKCCLMSWYPIARTQPATSGWINCLIDLECISSISTTVGKCHTSSLKLNNCFSLTTFHVWLQLTFLPLLCVSYLHSITLSHLSFCFWMTFTNTLWFSLMHMLCTDISLQYFSSASKHLSLSPHLQFNFWGNSIIMVQILPDDFPFRFGFIVFILCFNNLIMRTLVFRTPNIVLYLIPFHSIEPRLARF